MKYAFENFHEQVQKTLINTGKFNKADIYLEIPKAINIQADLALPCFKIAKTQNITPVHAAQELAESLTGNKQTLIGKIIPAGPFLNFELNINQYAQNVLREILSLKDLYGSAEAKNETVVVDYSSPNIAKRMHIGHIRSTIIGQSIVNILRFSGYHVIGDNHIGDWGKQFGVILAAIKKYGKPEGKDEEILRKLEEIYAIYSREMKMDTKLDEEARQWSLLLEQGNEDARNLWKWVVNISMSANQHSYERLHIKFDEVLGESFYENMLPNIIQEALDKNVAYKDQSGAIVVNLGDQVPTFLLQRSDGGTLYHTRDAATLIYRQNNLKANKIVYVVGIPQELHFRQLFALMKAMGYDIADNCIHVKFGTIFDQSGKAFSTRGGNMIYLDTLLDEAVKKAKEAIKINEEQISENKKDEIAEKIGVASVIYNDLYQPTERDITLDWNRMLSLEGNSAPYLLYTYTRCKSILREAKKRGIISDENSLPGYNVEILNSTYEISLIKNLGIFPIIVSRAAKEYAPYIIAEWCFNLAKNFSRFYEQNRILSDNVDQETRDARLNLISCVAQCLKNGLHLLNIQKVEQM